MSLFKDAKNIFRKYTHGSFVRIHLFVISVKLMVSQKNLVTNKLHVFPFRRSVYTKHYTYGNYTLVRVKKTPFGNNNGY